MLKKYIVRSQKLIIVLVNTVAVLRQGKLSIPLFTPFLPSLNAPLQLCSTPTQLNTSFVMSSKNQLNLFCNLAYQVQTNTQNQDKTFKMVTGNYSPFCLSALSCKKQTLRNYVMIVYYVHEMGYLKFLPDKILK